jgi:hypothetical protein
MFDIETAFDRVNETRSELLATLDISSGQWEQVLAVALLRDGFYWDAGTAFAGGGDVRSRARALLAIGDFDQAEDILVESVSPGELLFGYHRTLECLLHASRGSAEHRAHARRSAEALESFRHETHSPGDLSTTEEARRLISEAKRTPPSPLRQTRPSDRRSEGVEIAPIEQQPDGPSIPPPGLELPPPLP